jgi:filamentous hemagglutinin family protein
MAKTRRLTCAGLRPNRSNGSNRPGHFAGAMPQPVAVARRLSLALAAWATPCLALAAPQGGVVSSGSATIGYTGSAGSGVTTTIHQASQKAVINWQSFSVGASEVVNFVQPGRSAVTLNRVVGNERSLIEGALKANGQVFLLNSNGVLFAKGSSVSAAGLVASTLEMSDADFLAGKHRFSSASGQGEVRNQGQLSASEGGYVALLGHSVRNDGVVVATRGTVALASADRIQLKLSGDTLLGLTLTQGSLDALVDNQGAVYADGGRILLSAKAADALLGAQVNQTGLLQARTLADLQGGAQSGVQGEIRLNAEGGTTRVAGTLDASAPSVGNGGLIETSGTHVKVADGATLSTWAAHGQTGTWLVDPDGFIIGAGGDISAATLSQQLESNNVSLSSTNGSGSDGDLQVNDAVSWAANTTLSLSATRNILVNAPITATGQSAGLVLEAGNDYRINTTAGASITLSGAQASLQIQGESYTLIHSLAELAALDDDYGAAVGFYALAQNLDASGNRYASALISTLTGGALAGLGHQISHLSVHAADADATNLGLIGVLDSDSVVRDIGLSDVSVSGASTVGALVAENYGKVYNSYSTGTVSGNGVVGGLVGSNLYGSISQSWSGAQIGLSTDYGQSGGSDFGGLVGQNYGGRISDAYASGAVSLAQSETGVKVLFVGGLVGANISGVLLRTHASGDVTALGGSYVGGLVGNSNGSGAMIIASYATGKVTGEQQVGGLAGGNSGSISGSYASGSVQAWSDNGSTAYAGGLVGVNDTGGSIANSYATGSVSGNVGIVAGLVGSNSGAVSSSYASGTVNGSEGAAGLVGANGTTGVISDSYSTSQVSGKVAGGLAVSNNGSISDSQASGNVTGSERAAGLVVGNEADGSISNASASGNVSGGGSFASGALVAVNEGSISDSSATGTLSGLGNADGSKLTGENSGSLSNSSYHDAAAEAAAQARSTALQNRVAAGTQAAQISMQSAATATPPEAVPAVPGDEPSQRKTRRPASLESRLVQAAPARPAAQDGARYRANIQRIEVDGQVFELEDPSAPPSTASPAQPAASKPAP